MISIAPLVSAHAVDVARIFEAGIADGNATFVAQAPSWSSFDESKLAGHRFVALVDGVVAGWVAVAAYSAREIYAGVVEDALYVDPAYAGRGLGRALLGACVASTEAAGIWTVQARIFTENAASLRVHSAVGFRTVGVQSRMGLMPYGPRAGLWRDVVLLERRSSVTGL